MQKQQSKTCNVKCQSVKKINKGDFTKTKYLMTTCLGFTLHGGSDAILGFFFFKGHRLEL